MARVESNFNRLAVSKKDAIGLFQVMPSTGEMYGVTRQQLFDLKTNIRVGLQYFKEMLNRFNNINLALAAYNSGPNRVINAGYKIPAIKETINYVRRVRYEERKYRKNRNNRS